jgi:Peptidase A4 family
MRTISARSAASAICFALVLAGCGSGRPARDQRLTDPAAASSDFGKFAGYDRFGRLHEIAASWTVPRIVGGRGAASTWIGAQAPGDPGPFIQIGTNEQRDTLPEKREYHAFWSDKTQQFHGIELFGVHPGDRISASLKQVHAQWKLAIVDANSGDRSIFEAPEEAKYSFNDAEWLQEDITDDRTGRPFPYPQLSPVGFRNLRVNSRPPGYAHVVSSWMSADKEDFAPTPLHGGGFTIHTATVSATGREYLRLAKGEDEATGRLDAQAFRWTAKTPRATVIRDVETFSRGLRANAQALAQVRWPAPVRH